MYDPRLVQPMRDELVSLGVKELKTPEEVDAAFAQSEESTFLVINSVCGCAAGGARPAVAKALTHSKLPAKSVTVFAGQDREATEKARGYLLGYPPSSPSFALLRGAEVLDMIPRQEIEGYTPEQISQKITAMFDSHL